MFKYNYVVVFIALVSSLLVKLLKRGYQYHIYSSIRFQLSGTVSTNNEGLVLSRYLKVSRLRQANISGFVFSVNCKNVFSVSYITKTDVIGRVLIVTPVGPQYAIKLILSPDVRIVRDVISDF